MYLIVFKKSAIKELQRLPLCWIKRIQIIVNALKIKPILSQTKKLQGYQNLYRIRSGTYRLIYLVDTKSHTITITKVAHRREVYR
ncbi:MAG: type II toxin-antitoxin system RelE/ParE family toxin [bacterium]